MMDAGNAVLAPFPQRLTRDVEVAGNGGRTDTVDRLCVGVLGIHASEVAFEITAVNS